MKKDKATTEAYQHVFNFLVRNGYEVIAGDLDEIPAKYQRALSAMITEYDQKGKPDDRTLITSVIHDIAGLCTKDKHFLPRCNRFTRDDKKKGAVA